MLLHRPISILILTSPSSFLGGFGIDHMSSPTPEPVTRTSSYGTPSPSEDNNDEQLPLRPVAHGAAIAADAASPREHTLLVRCTLPVSHSSSATSAPPARRGNGKRQKTASAWSLVPSPHTSAPAPRQGGLATVATQANKAIAPTRWRRSTGSSVKRAIVKQAASLLNFDNVLVGYY